MTLSKSLSQHCAAVAVNYPVVDDLVDNFCQQFVYGSDNVLLVLSDRPFQDIFEERWTRAIFHVFTDETTDRQLIQIILPD